MAVHGQQPPEPSGPAIRQPFWLALAAVGAGLLLAVLVLVWGRGGGPVPTTAAAPEPKSSSAPRPAPPPQPKSPLKKDFLVPDAKGPLSPAAAALRAKLNEFARQFAALGAAAASGDRSARAKAMKLLADLREAILGAEDSVATAAMLDFLRSGRDAPTGLRFSVDSGGVLASAPSVRTALLDLLAQTDPAVSVAFAREIFGVSTVPDEWALALRNMAWQNRDGAFREELQTQYLRLLNNPDWLAKPTAGFLEAFDIGVHLASAAEVAALADLVRVEDTQGRPLNNGVSRAAFIALDRISIADPALVLSRLTADSGLLAWAPENRAALVARANVSDPGQRESLEAYLLSPNLTPAERETFSEIFPNRNGVLGDTLASVPNMMALDFKANLAGDRAALDTVTRWLADPRFQRLKPELETIKARLQDFVAAAAASGPVPAPSSSPIGRGSKGTDDQ